MITFATVTRSLKILPIAALLVLSAACGRTFVPGAAVVDGHRISEGRLNREVKIAVQGGRAAPGEDGRREAERQVLGELIKRELLRAEADKRGIDVPKSRIDQEFDQIRSQFPSEAELVARIKEAGFTIETLRDAIEEQLVVQELQTVIVGTVTDADVREVYTQSKEQYRQVRVRHILVQVDQKTPDAKAKKEAGDALAKLRAGVSFRSVAKQTSDDPGSKDSGGLLPGWTTLATLDPAFARASWDAGLRKVVGPVRSSFGYHVIEVLGKRYQSLSEVGPQIREQLTQQQGQSALQGFIERASARADIDVNPRIGDWDAATGTIVAHKSFEPAEPAVDEDQPPTFLPPGLTPDGQAPQ